jgi:hypothetical protein
MSILNNYKRPKNCLALVKDKYYDFVLSNDTTESINISDAMTTDGLCGYIDFTKNECVSGSTFMSLPNYTWEDAINSGETMLNVGFTGIDNGFIKYNSNISDVEFYNMIVGSEYRLEPNDYKMHVFPVNGNTETFSYDYSYKPNEYISLYGGFLQGIFKAYGYDYQILPTVIEDALEIEFVLRPKDYEERSNTLNSLYPENKGIFFYMGTRAENKFVELYGADLSEYPYRGVVSASTNEYVHDYIEEFINDSSSTANSGITSEFDLSGTTILDSNGEDIAKEYPKEVATDNKFITFNHTPSGFTVNNYYEDADVVIQFDKKEAKENLFLLMNHTKTGLTVNTINKYIEETTSFDYDTISDIQNNSFALKLNEDMSIGYRYLVKDCDNENGYSVKEEKTVPNIISKDKWSVISVKIKILNGATDQCGNPLSKRKMKIFIYVNGYLKLVSQELDEFNFKELDDNYTRQELVPFSISIGGGSQGLCESINLTNREHFQRVLPIEKNFAGSFIGDIRSFKIYSKDLQYNEIKNNYLHEINSFNHD